MKGIIMLNFIFKERFAKQSVFDIIANIGFFALGYTLGFTLVGLVIFLLLVTPYAFISVWGTKRFG